MPDSSRPSSLRRLIDVFRRPAGQSAPEPAAGEPPPVVGPHPVDARTGFESEVVRRVWEILEAKRGDRAFLARRDIDPADLVFALPLVALIEVHHGEPVRYRYRLTGTGLREIFGFEATGLWLDGFPDAERAALYTATGDAVVRGRRSIVVRRTIQLRSGKLLRYETLLVPLAADGDTIDMLFVVMGMLG